MNTLHILTPCTRVENLSLIQHDLFNYTNRIHFIWHIAVDKKVARCTELADNNPIQYYHYYPEYNNAIAGHINVNHIIDSPYFKQAVSDEDFIYRLDDDNLIHPELVSFCSNGPIYYDTILFSQEWNTGKLRLSANKNLIKVGHVDTAMFLVKRRAIGDTRYRNTYDGDGDFISRICRLHPPLIIQKTMAYYNKLQANEVRSTAR